MYMQQKKRPEHKSKLNGTMHTLLIYSLKNDTGQLSIIISLYLDTGVWTNNVLFLIIRDSNVNKFLRVW